MLIWRRKANGSAAPSCWPWRGSWNEFLMSAQPHQLGAQLELSAPTDRDALVGTLGRSRTPRAVQELGKVLYGSDPAAREISASLLALHGEEGRRLLLDELASEGSFPVAEALWALGDVGTASDAPAMVRFVTAKELAVSANALGGLGELASRNPLPKVTLPRYAQRLKIRVP